MPPDPSEKSKIEAVLLISPPSPFGLDKHFLVPDESVDDLRIRNAVLNADKWFQVMKAANANYRNYECAIGSNPRFRIGWENGTITSIAQFYCRALWAVEGVEFTRIKSFYQASAGPLSTEVSEDHKSSEKRVPPAAPESRGKNFLETVLCDVDSSESEIEQ